ncbi:predicted protein [Nematostella vectensis]|uniref:Signal recognition particle 19 kDa protein n=1 Tax=Nematostella vectensis TaxID=45351 RepID=A7RJY5_NEMVE|nr:predicted protein [Nematostella vectensis]|eukprot:XP_001640123.1 predicted protein [Nematostella vectensis]
MAVYLSDDPASKDRWVTVYPAYLNSRRTVCQGRRVPKAKAVDNPTVSEIRDICTSQNLSCELENNKFYPKESAKDVVCKGRVRIQLKNSDGTPVNADIPNRKALFCFLGEMIPKLKTRQTKTGQSDGNSSQQQAAASKKKKGKKAKGK